MTKFKKTFLTIASALCCVLCSALAILGLIPEKKVQAEETSAYETATVYDVSQLNTNGGASIMGDTAWFDGKTLNSTKRAFDLAGKGYVATKTGTTYVSNSVGVTLKAYTTEANKWSADNKSAIRLFMGYTEVRWYYRASDGGFKFEVFDHAESGVPNHATRVNNGSTYYTTGFDSTQPKNYKVVKSMVTADSSSYKVDIYIDGTLEYTASVSSIAYDLTNATMDRFDLRSGSATDIVIESTYSGNTQAKDVYDYYADNTYLSGKAFKSTWDNTTNKATLNADVFDRTGMTDVSADSFGVTFKAKFDADVVAGREVLRARIGSTFDVRLSVVTAGTNGKAQINAFDWQSQSATNKILGATAYQFSIDLTQEHTYSFIKEKLEGTTSGYVYSAYVDGVLIQKAVYNVAPAESWGGSNDYNATNRMRIMIQNGNYTGTFSSAKYYGVKVDGVMNKANLGERYTLTAPTTDKLFFGYKDTQGNVYQAGESVSRYTELTSITLSARNEKGAAVRFLHAGASSLKWTTYINKADLDELQNEFTVMVYREVTTAEDASKKIYKEVAISDMAIEEGEYKFAQILSNIDESHFEWVFAYKAYVEIKFGDEVVGMVQIANNENERSISYVAERAYNDVLTVEEYEALTDEDVKAEYDVVLADGRYTRYSEEQREILKQYFTSEPQNETTGE